MDKGPRNSLFQDECPQDECPQNEPYPDEPEDLILPEDEQKEDERFKMSVPG
jgi:hypothetical protein